MEMIYTDERWNVEAKPRVIDDTSISFQRNHDMEGPLTNLRRAAGMSKSSRILCPIISIDLTAKHQLLGCTNCLISKPLTHFDVCFPKGPYTLFNDKL